jgi:hypothetical protein
MAHAARAEVDSRPVGRAPSKPKGKTMRVHVILSAEMIELIDRVCVDLADESGIPGATRATRTDAMKALILEGLRKRGLLK